MKLNKQRLAMGVFTLLSTPFIAFSIATASPIFESDIFSAIDGETDYSNSAQSTDFDMTANTSESLTHVLQGVDGEYDDAMLHSIKVNYSPSHSSLKPSVNTSPLDDILSSLDGEYFE